MTAKTYQMDLSFQPVVRLNSGDLDHHEILAGVPGADLERLPDGVLDAAGDLGAAIDLAVCHGAIQLLKARPNDKLLLPLSWRSCALDSFRNELLSVLRTDPAVRSRLILEFIAADDLLSVEEGSNYLAALRRQGCRICLSHFGSSSASYRFLRYLDVDYVKIDSNFFTAALTDPCERRLLNDVCALCQELDYRSIATGIDDSQLADMAAQLGFTMGQGRIYGLSQNDLPANPLAYSHFGYAAAPSCAPFFLN